MPYGAQVIHKTSEATSQFMRVLLLPEIKPTGQPKTVLTPAVSFQEGQKILIVQNGVKATILLTRLIACTHSYYQFEYEKTKHIAQEKLEALSINQQVESFDSLWKKL